jgi:hypothetical protein
MLCGNQPVSQLIASTASESVVEPPRHRRDAFPTSC